MYFIELFVIAFGLSMDAFAVSICKGLATQKANWKQAGTCALWFGGFQALMPMLGYFLGQTFADLVASVDHWIAFFLLAWIGINMIVDANKEEEIEDGYTPSQMLPLAIATSIDALAAGVSFSLKQINIWQAITIIGITTGAFSAVGVKFGVMLGEKFKKRAQIAGGIALLTIGTFILLNDLGIL